MIKPRKRIHHPQSLHVYLFLSVEKRPAIYIIWVVYDVNFFTYYNFCELFVGFGGSHNSRGAKTVTRCLSHLGHKLWMLGLSSGNFLQFMVVS